MNIVELDHEEVSLVSGGGLIRWGFALAGEVIGSVYVAAYLLRDGSALGESVFVEATKFAGTRVEILEKGVMIFVESMKSQEHLRLAGMVFVGVASFTFVIGAGMSLCRRAYNYFAAS